MSQKTRGYSDLGVVSAFLYISAALCAMFGCWSALLAATGNGQYFVTYLMGGSIAFGAALQSVCLAGFLRLARHVADDVYMLRLIAQNDWRERHQGVP